VSIQSNRSHLVLMSEDLAREWNATKESWRDEKARDFERDFMEQLPGNVRVAAATLEKLDKLLRKVKADCE